MLDLSIDNVMTSFLHNKLDDRRIKKLTSICFYISEMVKHSGRREQTPSGKPVIVTEPEFQLNLKATVRSIEYDSAGPQMYLCTCYRLPPRGRRGGPGDVGGGIGDFVGILKHVCARGGGNEGPMI